MKSFSSSPFHLHQRKLGMGRCVPNWDLDDTAAASTTLPAQPHSDALSTVPDHPMLDYEVAELTWENGQLAMHGLGLPRTVAKTASRYAWEKPRAAGTLESIVDLATCPPPPPKVTDDLVPWFDHPTTTRPAMDALVPCSNIPSSAGAYQARASGQEPTHGTRMMGPSTVLGSCSGAASEKGEEGAGADAAAAVGRKRMRMARATTHEGSGRDSRHVTMDTCEMDMDVGFTSTSPENTSFGQPISSLTKTTTVDDHDSDCLTRIQRRDEMGSEDETKGKTEKSTVSTKRSRAAAVHNQSERERRDRINQRMKTLQRLVPNSSKTDKASVLDEVIEYLKQLQGQVQMMSKLSSISQMMMPMSMQQLQMSMMAQMGMSMGMGMGVMDMNSVNRFAPPAAAIPPMIHPAAFLPVTASWDGSVDRLPQSSGAVLPDPFSAFLACQAQQQQQQQQPQPQPQPQLPMTLDAYNRLAALYQQQQLQPQQPTPPGGKT